MIWSMPLSSARCFNLQQHRCCFGNLSVNRCRNGMERLQPRSATPTKHCLDVHGRCQVHDLEERLMERSDIMLEESLSTVGTAPRRWLSHRQNMDIWVRRILEELPHHEMGRLQRIRTHGAAERWGKGSCRRPWKVFKSASLRPQSETRR